MKKSNFYKFLSKISAKETLIQQFNMSLVSRTVTITLERSKKYFI